MIKKIEPKYLNNIHKFLKQSWIDTYVPLGISKNNIEILFSDKKKWLDDFQKVLNDRNFISSIFLDNNIIIGLIFGYKNNNISFIQSLYIDKKYQNKKIGSKLIKNFEQKSKTPIVVGVLGINKKAQGFYKKLGYKVTGKYNFFSFTKKLKRKNIFLKKEV